MGNLHSSWINRHNGQNSNNNNNSNNTSFPTMEEHSPSPLPNGGIERLQYNLRRTASRLRRRVISRRRGGDGREGGTGVEREANTTSTTSTGNLDEVSENNTSGTSINSTGSRSRRRAREVSVEEEREEEETMLEENIRNAARRIRIDAAEALARQAFTPDPDDTAMYFYFPMSMDSAENNTSGNSNNISVNNENSSSRIISPSPLRRSARLSNSTPSPSPQPLQQHVLVRLRHVRPDTNDNSNNTNMTTESGNMSTFQWTIYFVLPRQEGSPAPVPPSAFNPNDAIQRAFAVLRAMMAGDNMGYEEWTRLQEMLGNVNRGVSKEQVEAQCASQSFTSHLNIGISCPICLAEYADNETVRTLPCLHSFHADCIDTWLTSCNNCPLCRQPPVQVES